MCSETYLIMFPLFHGNWFQCSSTERRSRMLQRHYALKMRNSAFSSHLLQTFSTKCSKRSHYTSEVKIFAFITHLFEHWPHPQPAKCCVWQLQSCFACHHFQIIYHLQLADFSCHPGALRTLWESSWCIRGTKVQVFIRKCIYTYSLYAPLMNAHTKWK